MNDIRESSPCQAIPNDLLHNAHYSWCNTDISSFGCIWTLKKCSYLLRCFDRRIKSSTFTTTANDKSKWRLILHPKRRYNHPTGVVSLILRHYRDDNSFKVAIAFDFSVLKNDTQKERIDQVKTNYTFRKKPYEDVYVGWIQCDYLMNENNRLLNNDELTIVCEIFPSKIENTNGHHPFRPMPIKDTGCGLLADDLGRLLNSHACSDVVLIADNKELHAHKALLAARSPVFEAMLVNDMMEKLQNRVVISDIPYDVLEELIKFVYTGKAPPTMDETMGMQLLSAADKYGLEDLKVMCELELSVKLTPGNVAQLVRLASMHNAIYLKTKLVDFMKSRVTEDVLNDLWNRLLSNYPQLFAEVIQARDATGTTEESPRKKSRKN